MNLKRLLFRTRFVVGKKKFFESTEIRGDYRISLPKVCVKAFKIGTTEGANICLVTH